MDRASRSAFWTFASGAVAFVLSGCGGNHGSLEQKLVELRQEVIRVQNAHDRLEERLGALEAQELRLAGPSFGSPAARSEPVDRPELPVVKLTPEDAPPEELAGSEPSGDEPRPLLRAHGDRILSRAAPEAGSARATAPQMRNNGARGQP